MLIADTIQTAIDDGRGEEAGREDVLQYFEALNVPRVPRPETMQKIEDALSMAKFAEAIEDGTQKRLEKNRRRGPVRRFFRGLM